MSKFIISFFLFLVTFGRAEADMSFRCIVLNVGEGQAILLQRGDQGLLIDTSHFGQSHDMLEAIEKYGVREVNTIILTHLHPDHASGIFNVMEKYPQALIYETGHRVPFNQHRDAVRWVAEALDSNKWQVRKIDQGDNLNWFDVDLKVLWPKDVIGDDLNAQSLVLSLKYKDASLLFMGDVGHKVEKQLIEENRLPDKVDLLVVGHHGAKDTTSDEFLARITVVEAVISINNNNLRGYPADEVILKLQKKNIPLHLTGRDGDYIWSQ